MGMTGFWLERTDSIHQLNIVLYTLASGTLAPIALYPGFVKSVVNLLPYRAIIDTPLTILTNGDSSLIIIQLVWAVILSLVYKIVFRAGFKRLEVVGV
jgi:ABC-2 type transport system permease protein